METIFSKILDGRIPCKEVYSDDKCLAFHDIEPQAPVHILLIPRKVITSLKDAEEEDKELFGHLLITASNIAKSQNLSEWRTVINTGESAGQTVFHVHLHILGGRIMKWPPG